MCLKPASKGGNMTAKKTGDKLKIWRNAHNLTLKQVEKSTGIPASLISLYENGKVNPSANKLKALCDHYQHSLEELMDTGEGKTQTTHDDEPNDDLFIKQQETIHDQAHTIRTQSDTIAKLVTLIPTK